MEDYRTADLPIEQRVDDLLDRMTTEEKLGQLLVLPDKGTPDEIRDHVGPKITGDHLGQISPVGRTRAPDDPGEVVSMINDLQRVAIEETRLGIPLLVVSNAVHGNAMIQGCAVFPHNFGIAATRDEELVERTAEVTAAEMAATGVQVNYGPIADVCRDPRWGRTHETFGESPYLCGRLSAAQVRGYQGTEHSVRSTVKHFPAYGEPRQGEDAAVNELSESTFRRMHLTSHRHALAEGPEGVMPCYNSIDGEPVHGSSRYLDDLLREELGFDGFVVSDHHGVKMLTEEHRTAESMREAIRQSMAAGIDAFLDRDVVETYLPRLESLVEEDELSEARLDEAVRRVLETKFELGLFEDPYVDETVFQDRIGTDDHEAITREAARESITLLKNQDDLLPLSPDVEEVFVTGPVADEIDYQLGGWSRVDSQDGVSVRAGIESIVGSDTTVSYEKGAGLRTAENLDAVAERAADADAAVVVLGDGAYVHEFGLSPYSGETGEFPTRTQLELPEAQQSLLETVHETGTPTIGVFVIGRPPVIPWAADNVPALLMGYYPGSAGGTAIAEVLFGETNPSGVLPVSILRSEGHLPTQFNHLKQPQVIGEDEYPDTYDPLYPFGHGLSYTDFEVSGLEVTPETPAPTDTVSASVAVENVGDRAGNKAIDVFVRDNYSSRVTPVRELRGFEKVKDLEPGERRTVEVPIDLEDLAVRQDDGSRVVEPGSFDVTVAEETVTFDVVESE